MFLDGLTKHILTFDAVVSINSDGTIEVDNNDRRLTIDQAEELMDVIAAAVRRARRIATREPA